MTASNFDVRSAPESGHQQRFAMSAMCQQQTFRCLFDHLVGGAPFSRNEGPTARLYRQHDPLKARWMPHGPNSRRRPQPMTADELMTATQAATLKSLTQAAYELDAFKPNLTRTEADKRIAMLTAKLKLLDEPPHTL
jgi:hypothetical protein